MRGLVGAAALSLSASPERASRRSTREHGTITVRMWDNDTFQLLDRNGQELTSYRLQAA